MLSYDIMTLRADQDAEPPLAVSVSLFAVSGLLLVLLGSGVLG